MTTTVTAPSAPTTPLADTAWETTLPLDQIEPSPLNPRQTIDQAALAELADSIRRHGLLQPILVRDHPDPSRLNRWVIVAGERRWRAAVLAGLERIAVRVLLGLNDRDHLRLALVENLQRRDLNPLEEAEGYRRLIDEAGLTQKAVGESVNRSQPAIANALRLLELPEVVRERIRTGQLTASHGIALASFKAFPAIAERLATLAVEQNLPSKALEAKMPLPHDLRRDRLIEDLTYGAGFDREQHCRICPFQAYRVAGSSHFCLRPEHAAELRAAVREEQQARLATSTAAWRARQEALEAALAEGETTAVDDAAPALPILGDTLPWDAAEQITSYNQPPAGCSEACACRAVALSRGGDLTPICSDPARWRALREAQQLAKDRIKADAYAAGIAHLEAVVDSAVMPDWVRLLAVQVAWVASRVHYRAALADAASRHLASEPALANFNWVKVSVADLRPLVGTFAGVSPASLLAFVQEAVLRDDLLDRRDGYGARGDLATWWLGEPDTTAPSDEEDEHGA